MVIITGGGSVITGTYEPMLANLSGNTSVSYVPPPPLNIVPNFLLSTSGELIVGWVPF